jgi:hypothetical protein
LKKEIDLSFLVGRELIQVAIGLYQVSLRRGCRSFAGGGVSLFRRTG